MLYAKRLQPRRHGRFGNCRTCSDVVHTRGKRVAGLMPCGLWTCTCCHATQVTGQLAPAHSLSGGNPRRDSPTHVVAHASMANNVPTVEETEALATIRPQVDASLSDEVVLK